MDLEAVMDDLVDDLDSVDDDLGSDESILRLLPVMTRALQAERARAEVMRRALEEMTGWGEDAYLTEFCRQALDEAGRALLGKGDRDEQSRPETPTRRCADGSGSSRPAGWGADVQTKQEAEAVAIVRALAAMDAPWSAMNSWGTDFGCSFCSTDDSHHQPDCLWRRAQELVAVLDAQAAGGPGAPSGDPADRDHQETGAQS